MKAPVRPNLSERNVLHQEHSLPVRKEQPMRMTLVQRLNYGVALAAMIGLL